MRWLPCCLRRSLRRRREAPSTVCRGRLRAMENVRTRTRTLRALPCDAVTSVTARSALGSAPAARRCFGGGKSFLRLGHTVDLGGDLGRHEPADYPKSLGLSLSGDLAGAAVPVQHR